jgi:hypothetical protein
MQVKVKIDPRATREGIKLIKKAVKIVDRQENEFMIPYLRNYVDGRITVSKLIKAGIKRMVNPETLEVWYEQKGLVITPSFIRDLAGAFDESNC